VRGLPLDTTDSDLSRLLFKHGLVVRVLLLIHKAQAFVEFASLEMAQECLRQSDEAEGRGTGIYLHNSRLHLSYSGRENIEEDRVDQKSETAGRVLLVTITNVKYPVTADVLYTVFSKFGEVCRVVSFPRQLGEQALIEMKTAE
jgi:RNA recognition motif-containing protein